jgi:hypothetical protein
MNPETTSLARPSTPGSDRRTQTLAELAAEQGVTGPQDVDALIGSGAKLWDDEAAFETFLDALRESRRTGE